MDGRHERSRRTRARVIAAATRLLVDDGYLSTTVGAVADEAGVGVQTVYYLFGTKRNLLAAVLDASIAGDTDPVPVLARPWVDELAAADDAATAIALLVEASTAILTRAAPVYDVVRRAAADAEVGELLADNRARRRADQRHLVEVLADAGHLRPDVPVGRAADIVYALLNEEVILFLTVDCAWPPAEFRAWATTTLLHQLT